MIHRASRVLGLFASLVVLLHAPVAAQCIGGGVGGPIPATGTGNATWPAALPVAPLSSTLAVTVPSGATCLKSVKLQGLTHTWSGDVQFVLEDPAGGLHNVLCGMPSNPLEDFGGDYELVDPVQAVLGLTTMFSYSSNGNPIASGTYAQNFGGHIPGNHGIQNTPLEQIPIASGLWTLHAYDWFSGDSGALTSWELCFGTPTPPPPPPPTTSYTCLAAAAPAGVFPSSGGADGAWPLTLPMGELISSATVIPPAGATLAAVKLIGFQHTWSSDAMIVLESPNGQRHILWQRDNGSNCNGCADDFNGDYVFVSDPLAQQIPSCGVGSYPSGTYRQDTGGWNSGDALLLTTPIAQIPVSAGVWKLTCYDWCVAYDDGYLSAWELCFNAPATPQSYCTAGTSTNGCTATISANANPTVSRSAPCNLTVTNIEGQKSALVFYSVSGAQAVQWNTRSLLCLKAPTQRTTVQNSGGSIAGCNGSIQLDWNAFQAANPGALGAPWSVGDKVWLQAWHRDPPAGKSTNLSNALEMTYLP